MSFFSQSKTPPEKTPDNSVKKSIKHMDAVVTGVILGGIVGSIYGVKKLKEKQHHEGEEHINLIEENIPTEKKGFFARLLGR
jgi:hypothetical protein